MASKKNINELLCLTKIKNAIINKKNDILHCVFFYWLSVLKYCYDQTYHVFVIFFSKNNICRETVNVNKKS